MMGYLVMGAVMLLALAVVIYDRWRTARIVQRLDDMLTAAMNGTFSEETFDESRLSSLESRLGRYLAASALSSRNVREQKDQISALISDISHQTKTPVANLQLYAQLLSEQPLTPQGKDCAAAISAQAEKLQTLIEALVKTSRLETGILALHPQSGEISPVVERAAAQYAPKAAEKGIALTLRQRSGSAGPGISEEEQAKIFGRFYRAPGAWQAEGVGIGLYLTRQIAEKQGGYVKVESTPGMGSTFSLYLPRES